MPHAALPLLLNDAFKELAWLQKDRAALFGVSVRTLQRHLSTGGISSPAHYAKLVQALHPRKPELAARIAAAVGKSLPELGVHVASPAAPPVAAPPPPPRAAKAHAEAVICAAADALEASPRVARPVVAAIFARVRELGVDLGSLTQLLAETRVEGGKPESKKASVA